MKKRFGWNNRPVGTMKILEDVRNRRISHKVTLRYLAPIIVVLAALFCYIVFQAHLIIENPAKNTPKLFVGSGSSPFVGEWVSVSPATYYEDDEDGERMLEWSANYDLTIAEGELGYYGTASMTQVAYHKVPTYEDILPPMITQCPICFDSPGNRLTTVRIESSDTKMIIETDLRHGGTQRIVFDLVEADPNSGGKDTLYATLNHIPLGEADSGFVTYAPIVLVRK